VRGRWAATTTAMRCACTCGTTCATRPTPRTARATTARCTSLTAHLRSAAAAAACGATMRCGTGRSSSAGQLKEWEQWLRRLRNVCSVLGLALEGRLSCAWCLNRIGGHTRAHHVWPVTRVQCMLRPLPPSGVDGACIVADLQTAQTCKAFKGATQEASEAAHSEGDVCERGVSIPAASQKLLMRNSLSGRTRTRRAAC